MFHSRKGEKRQNRGKMKKYLFIYKTTLMENLQYIANIFLSFISFLLIIFIFLNLWQYIYSDSSNIIEGYSMTQMIWYVILTEIMWFGNRNGLLTNQISYDIKSGSIAYGLNKPYNYLYYTIAKHFGDVTIKLFLYLLVGISMGLVFAGRLSGFQFQYLPFIAISFILGLFVNALIRIAISISSFWIEDSKPIHWMYDKLILVIGTLFPVEMFPIWLQPAIKCSPIFVITYGPAKLIIDFSMEMFLQVVFAQIVYIVIAISILTLLYQRGVKRLNVNGG